MKKALTLIVVAMFIAACGGKTPEAEAPDAPDTPDVEAPDEPASDEPTTDEPEVRS